MASVGAYLKKLLYQYDCVVVPELGGFLTHYQPASFNAETGQFLPPRKRLAFNEALRLDDGILTNYMMLHESLSRDEAARHITDFVTDLKQHVQLAGSFSVEGIGLFTPNIEGKLQFDPELRHNFFGESFGMTAIQAERVTAVPVEVESVEAEEVPVYALGPVLREEVLLEGPFVQVSRPRPLLRWAAAVALIGSLGALSYLTVIEPGQPMESSLNPANWFRVPEWLQLKSEPVSQPAKEVAMVLPASPKQAPVLPTTPEPVATKPLEGPDVVANAIPVAVKPVAKEPKPAVTLTKTSEPKATVIAKPEPVKATLVETPIAATPQPEVTPEAIVRPEAKATGPLFTVIAGSFASKPNAVRFRKTLQKAGYSDAYIMAPSGSGKLYKVAAIGYPGRDEALASTDSLKKLTGITPFVIKY